MHFYSVIYSFGNCSTQNKFHQEKNGIEKNLCHFLTNLKTNKTSTTGEINISTGETFAVQFLSPIISKFRKIYPDVKIKISSRQPETIIDNLITNKTDFDFSTSSTGIPYIGLWGSDFATGLVTSLAPMT